MQRNSEKCRGGEYSQRLHQTLLFVNCLLPGYRILCYAWDHLVKEMSAISFNCSPGLQTFWQPWLWREDTSYTFGSCAGRVAPKWLEICVGRLLYGCKFSFTINVLKICEHRPTLEWGSGNLENWPWPAHLMANFTPALFLFYRTEMESGNGRDLIYYLERCKDSNVIQIWAVVAAFRYGFNFPSTAISNLIGNCNTYYRQWYG